MEFLGTCKALSADQKAEFEDKIEDLESSVCELLTNGKEDAEFERDEAERQIKELDAVMGAPEVEVKRIELMPEDKKSKPRARAPTGAA